MIEVDLALWASGENIPVEKQPLDAGFHELPERMLDAYQSDRKASVLGRILKTAAQLRERVDKIVVIGAGGSCLGARAMMGACCDPYHNELTRAQRGGRPRMYFEGDHVDNDWTQALLQFLESDSRGEGQGEGRGDSPEGNWGIILIDSRYGFFETSGIHQIFTDALKKKVGTQRLKDFIVPVACEGGRLENFVTEIDCVERFNLPEGVGEPFSVLSAAGLLPAAVLGIDVVKLLEAAAAMNSHFQTAEFGSNVVMDYVAVNHLLEEHRGVKHRVMSAWNKSLEPAVLWYDQLLCKSLGKHENGGRDKVVNNVIVGSWRQEHLSIDNSEWNQDQLNDLAEKTLPQIMDATIRRTNLAYKQDGRPTTDLCLPAADEAGLGQLFQMLMLATKLEGRLSGVNPYGQPSVGKYTNT